MARETLIKFNEPVVIYFYPGFSYPNGSLYDCYEYFCQMKLLNPDSKFLIIFDSRDKSLTTVVDRIFWFIKDKYKEKYWYFGDILFRTITEVMRTEFRKCLVLDNKTTEFAVYRRLLRANSIFVITDYSRNFDFIKYKSLEKLENCFLFGTLSDNYYIRKIGYSFFKDFSDFDNYRYINLVSKATNSNNIIRAYVANHPEIKFLASWLKLEFLAKSKNVLMVGENVKYFHQRFSSYVYFQTLYDDPSPRLPYECKYYGKETLYVDEIGIEFDYWKVNRYNDREFKSDDTVIDRMVN